MTSPRTNVCEASNYPWEKPQAAPRGCRGLTQIEFDVANMRVTGVVGKGLEKILLADRKSTRLNSSHITTSYAVFCLKKKKTPSRSCSGLCGPRPRLFWPCGWSTSSYADCCPC